MDAQGSQSSEEFLRITRQAASRWKLERVKGGVSLTLTILAVGGLFWLLLLAFRRSWIAPFPFVMAGAALALLAAALAGWCRRPKHETLHRGLDRRLGLPDLALSSGELTGEDAWRALLHRQTLARLQALDWAQVWPVPWPKWTGASTLSLAACVALLGFFYHAEVAARQASLSRPVPKDARTVALETVFKDWEEAKAKDEGLKKLMEETAPLRERLMAPGSNEKQRFADLNRLEEIVAAEKAKLEAQSLDPRAAALADALSPMEGMSALAAALRKKDFGKAADQAAQAAEKLGQAGAQPPQGAQEAGNAAQKLSEQLGQQGQQQQTSQALSQFSQGAKQSDAQKMSQGLNGLKQSFGQQCQRNEARKRLATQMAQLSFCKNPGNKPCDGQGMCLVPRLSFAKTNQQGKGAGSETNLNRFGAETNLASERQRESMNNTATEGESETTTLKSASGQAEAARATRGVNFEQYQTLSQQAIADEAIPAAHRQVIKTYFETIRPKTEK